MAIVNGHVLDFSLIDIENVGGALDFIPSGPGVREDAFLHARPIPAVLDVAGAFSVNLAATDAISPPVWYYPRVKSLDPVGGYIFQDYPEWKIRVPVEGGTIGDLISRPLGTGEVWEYSGPGDPPDSTRGDYVYDPTTGLITKIV